LIYQDKNGTNKTKSIESATGLNSLNVTGKVSLGESSRYKLKKEVEANQIKTEDIPIIVTKVSTG
jgi:hypothetical protein